MAKPHLNIPFILDRKKYKEFHSTEEIGIWLIFEIDESTVETDFKNYSYMGIMPVIDI